MTKREAAIVSAYTGYLCGDFNKLHKYIEELMERPVFTHELGSKVLAEEIQKRATKDFLSLEITD